MKQLCPFCNSKVILKFDDNLEILFLTFAVILHWQSFKFPLHWNSEILKFLVIVFTFVFVQIIPTLCGVTDRN